MSLSGIFGAAVVVYSLGWAQSSPDKSKAEGSGPPRVTTLREFLKYDLTHDQCHSRSAAAVDPKYLSPSKAAWALRRSLIACTEKCMEKTHREFLHSGDPKLDVKMNRDELNDYDNEEANQCLDSCTKEKP